MEFTLFYCGEVKSPDRASMKHKHKIRRCFRKQLDALRNLKPLCDHEEWFKPDWRHGKEKVQSKLIKEKSAHGIRSAFLVSKKLDMYAELSIKVLIPKTEGSDSQKSNPSFKDIDNKMKTLCDALFFPNPCDQLPLGQTAEETDEELLKLRDNPNEPPFLCLLEDDELIYKMEVDTDYLLAPSEFRIKKEKSIWFINVKIKGNRFHEEYKDLIV